ncbi:unnamed protein product [Rangifer tarandus platyrhynchus]|uniref:Uncharacterized protein n=1 Tax=Rangifer tarandus platyrhynchus TaxID=3082113 RepID=A0ABN9A1I9_RANTA|nr:unnamed protein product [Rangifer tarandus platyrhynchus]
MAENCLGICVRSTKNSIFHEERVMPMVVMVTSFKRTYARTVTVSVPEAMAGHCPHTPPTETPDHSLASLVASLLLAPGSWCTQGSVCAFQESVSLVLWKFRNQTHWPPEANMLGILSPFAGSIGWEICLGS